MLSRPAERTKFYLLLLLAFVLIIVVIVAVYLGMLTPPCNDENVARAEIAFDTGFPPDIYLMDSKGHDHCKLTFGAREGIWSYSPDWSPDGSQIAFTVLRDENTEIYVMQANGSNPRNLTNHPAIDRYPEWSPDGRQIAFETSRDGYWAIYVMNADGSNPKVLFGSTNNEADGYTWSPDSLKIAFYAQGVTFFPSGMYVLHRDSSETELLTEFDGNSLAWSPDGQRIAFMSFTDATNADIYVMDADSRNISQLTNNPRFDGLPSWSPDSQQIVFVSERDGNGEIYVMNADGSNQYRLTNNPVFDTSPAWRPMIGTPDSTRTQ